MYYLVLKLSNKMLIFIDNLFMQKFPVTLSVLCIITIPIYRIGHVNVHSCALLILSHSVKLCQQIRILCS